MVGGLPGRRRVYPDVGGCALIGIQVGRRLLESTSKSTVSEATACPRVIYLPRVVCLNNALPVDADAERCRACIRKSISPLHIFAALLVVNRSGMIQDHYHAISERHRLPLRCRARRCGRFRGRAGCGHDCPCAGPCSGSSEGRPCDSGRDAWLRWIFMLVLEGA